MKEYLKENKHTYGDVLKVIMSSTSLKESFDDEFINDLCVNLVQKLKESLKLPNINKVKMMNNLNKLLA